MSPRSSETASSGLGPNARASALDGRPAARLERGTRAFFRSFFRLLMGFVACAEWVCVAWLLFSLGVHVPPVVHVLAPLAIFVVNHVVIVRSRASGGRWKSAVDRLVHGYAAVAFTSIFCTLFLVVAAVPACVGLLVAWVLGERLPPGVEHTVSQIYFALVNAGLIVVAGLMLYGYTFGRRELTISRLKVAIRGLPQAFNGSRIVHLSDLHIGRYLDLAELADHVRRVNELSPDLICVTGDLVDRPDTCERAFPVLAGLRARHGVFVTLGNHDVYAGAATVTAALRRLTPFTVLRNACAEVRVDGATLALVGVDDLGRDWARGVLEHPALPPLAASVPAGTPFIVLSHRPDCFRQAARLGAPLMLSGHTHGGQIALPAWLSGRARNIAEFITAFDRGLYRDGDATLYVNLGLGFTGQRVRVFTPREIACFELSDR